MGRPKNRDGIRARSRRDGVQEIHFEEAPGRWIASPETDRAAALSWARRNRERLVASKKSTIEELGKGFFAWDSPWVRRQREHGKDYTEKWLKIRQGYFDNHILPPFGKRTPDSLTRREIDNQIMASKSVQRDERPLSGASKNKILYTFKTMYEEWIDLRFCQMNPLAGLTSFSKIPTRPRDSIPREHVPILFPNGHGDLIKIWGEPMWASCMLVLSDTGMRPVEVSRMKWSNLFCEEYDENVLWSFVFPGAKGGRLRAVGISERTAQELAIFRAQSRYSGDDDLIFTKTGTSGVTDAAILDAFRRGTKVAGLGDIGASWTTYYLRHTFVNHSMSVLTESEVSMLAGHSVAVSRAHYQHADIQTALDRSREARAKLVAAREEQREDRERLSNAMGYKSPALE